MMVREELLKKLAAILEELFEIKPENVVPEALLYEDLDLDSIDAIDLIVHIQALTGQRVDPDEFKAVRSVSDVLDSLEKMMASNEVTKH